MTNCRPSGRSHHVAPCSARLTRPPIARQLPHRSRSHAAFLPAPFRPKVAGYGLAGICLIRMAGSGRAAPSRSSASSENARPCVSPRGLRPDGGDRASTSRAVHDLRLVAFAAPRFFPGVHYMAKFQVEERPTRFVQIGQAESAILRPGGPAGRGVAGRRCSLVGGGVRVLPRRATATPTPCAAGKFEGVELRIPSWEVKPLGRRKGHVRLLRRPGAFPAGTAEFDNALLMRDGERVPQPRLVLLPHAAPGPAAADPASLQLAASRSAAGGAPAAAPARSTAPGGRTGGNAAASIGGRTGCPGRSPRRRPAGRGCSAGPRARCDTAPASRRSARRRRRPRPGRQSPNQWQAAPGSGRLAGCGHAHVPRRDAVPARASARRREPPAAGAGAAHHPDQAVGPVARRPAGRSAAGSRPGAS